MTRLHPILAAAAVIHGLMLIASLAAHLAGLVILAAVAHAAGRRLVPVVRATTTRPDPVTARGPRPAHGRPRPARRRSR